jgi:hypothetical protein
MLNVFVFWWDESSKEDLRGKRKDKRGKTKPACRQAGIKDFDFLTLPKNG